MNKDKLYNILTSDNIEISIKENLDYLLEIMPELKDMIGFPHNHPHHHLDVWNHTLFALSISQNDFDIRLSLLLHDIGKPHSYQDGEIRHFKGHPEVSSKMSKVLLCPIREVCAVLQQRQRRVSSQVIPQNSFLSSAKSRRHSRCRLRIICSVHLLPCGNRIPVHCLTFS